MQIPVARLEARPNGPRIIEVANQPRFAETPPARIVPALADEGIYLASEASFRIACCVRAWPNEPQRPGPQHRHGRRARRAPTSRPAPARSGAGTSHSCRHKSRVTWFYLYLILDYSAAARSSARRVHDTDSAEHAVHLARRAAHPEECTPCRCVRCCTAITAPL